MSVQLIQQYHSKVEYISWYGGGEGMAVSAPTMSIIAAEMAQFEDRQ